MHQTQINASNPGFDLFDSRGRFIGIEKVAAHVAAMDPDTRARFNAVKDAAAECEAATAAVRGAEQAVDDALIEMEESEQDLARMRPVTDRISEARLTFRGNN